MEYIRSIRTMEDKFRVGFILVSALAVLVLSLLPMEAHSNSMQKTHSDDARMHHHM